MRRRDGYGFHSQRNYKTEGRKGNNYGRTDRDSEDGMGAESYDRGDKRGGRGKGRGRPPGLKGREIGLYYRDKMRSKKQASLQRIGVSLDPRREQQIRELLSSIGTSDLHRDVKCELNSEPDDFAFSGTRYFSLHDKPKVKCELGSEVGECSSAQDFSVDVKRKVKLEVGDKSGEISAESTRGTRRVYNESDVKPGPSSTDNHGSSAADRYSHISESSFKRKFLQNITGNIEANLGRSLLVGTSLVQDKELDELFKMRLIDKQNSKRYKKMMEFRQKLPSFGMKDQILDLVEQNQVTVISGETGCGKTTQVAQFILDSYIMKDKGSVCRIICTQPRRISATSVASRVAEERDEVCGEESVGYQIRLEKRMPRKKGSILFCTTGVMLQWMQSDPVLREVSHIVLDEIHERDVISDFVMTILKDIIQKRSDLKVILMSATLNAEQFSKYYGDCPCLNIPGFTYPVKEYYLEDVLQMTRFEIEPTRVPDTQGWKKHLKFVKARVRKVQEFENFIEPYVRYLASEGKYSSRVLEMLKSAESEEINLDLIVALIQHICVTKDDGAILIFLPGWDKISSLHKLLKESVNFPSSRYQIIPLHSLMPTVIQRSVFDRPPKGVRKIVIATNIAETSITIDDVVYVIDCGKIKLKNFDVNSNISTLRAEWVSLANARQRRGRAGRVQPGECYHLYTKAREMTLADYPLPEMLRTRLDEVILQIKILQLGKTKPFLEQVMNPPDPRAVELSIKLLENLNALDADENLTPLGFHLARLPLDPQTGKMILMGALFSCVDPIFSVAASLSFKDAFHVPLGREEEVNQKKLCLSKGLKSDHLVLAEALKQWEVAEEMRRGREFCWDYFLSSNTLSLLRDMKGQFAEHLHEMNFLSSRDPKAEDANINSSNSSLVKAIICAGLYPNVAIVRSVVRRRKMAQVNVKLTTPEDGRVYIHPRSINEKQLEFESPFLVYHLKLKSTSIYLHDTTMVYPLPLLFFGQGVDVCIEDGLETIAVDKSIRFKCQESTANLVKELRTQLDQLLEYKISHPGTINWNRYSTEGAVLRAIIELITSEDKQMMLVAQEGEDGFSD
ncbi:ATP-dependent RNA helicase DHX36 [Cryptotermes secundus]|nr:ATP-dependent DNA/RNA helicase DHX36 isoform X3 [Cryptotermes secundus]XP_023703042.1 ATP-dependent DNA/RNA helicase DHX36 isoform X3 [Cryptotermes secundus]XP_023703043.1 ATP-dependent DNA/RNA helicase DHX36 isoform X3 [Cryptotermes secundus]XP_023703045.1 ATP-dependent DNA/RNA helicase DHX36 isoform X3 [Cryptotermes secundus]XP_023703046.1 ATP-dependent DNA/RNA helicase DHX36 isoform X3 [Cryptotermes secundus]XP_023703047.1 ATP-dependent DNA/RNA helicase DHX36 isoform X3 [Cryptotermes sec